MIALSNIAQGSAVLGMIYLQRKNAQALVDRGAAVMVLQKDCTAQRLMEEINGLLGDRERYSNMCKALQEMAIPDCAERVCRIMEQLAKN